MPQLCAPPAYRPVSANKLVARRNDPRIPAVRISNRIGRLPKAANRANTAKAPGKNMMIGTKMAESSLAALAL